MGMGGDLAHSAPSRTALKARRAACTLRRRLEIKMSTFVVPPNRRSTNLRGSEESLIDYQRRREIEAEARLEHRRREIAEQTLEQNLAGIRIRAWEKVHALRMPSDPQHPILDQIAIATQLSLQEIHEEQRIRCGVAAT
jgi:hypothetical protein